MNHFIDKREEKKIKRFSLKEKILETFAKFGDKVRFKVPFNDTTTTVSAKFSYTESEGISRRKQVSLANINIIGINFACTMFAYVRGALYARRFTLMEY